MSIGGVHSNHTRMIAAVAAKIGFKCRLVQESWVPHEDAVYDRVGNIMLSRIMGADVQMVDEGFDIGIRRSWEEAIEDVKAKGGKPYAIPAGASVHKYGGLGYVGFAEEVREQEKELGFAFDYIVVCTVTGSTHAGMLVGFAYSTEFFMAWYSGNEWEGFVFKNRAFGAYGWAYFIMFTCNAIVPQIFWFKKMRRHTWVLFVVSILVNVGMWFERYVIVVTSLHRDFLPSSWGMYALTRWDYMVLIGSFGLFFTLFLLFVRVLPVIAISEVKGVMDPKVAKSAPTDTPAAVAARA